MEILGGGSRVVACALVALVGCGAGVERVDPADLELRDLLGVTPKVAAAWTVEQREAARRVLADGLVERAPEALALAAPSGRIDEAQMISALAAVDGRLLERERDALGLVVVERLEAEGTGRAIDAPVAHDVLLGATTATTAVLELDPRAWVCPGDAPCDFTILAALAADAAPGATRVRVLPVAELTVIAAALPGDDAPTLLVNPIVTALGAPAVNVATAATGGAAPAFAASAVRPTVQVLPLVTSTWSYDPSVGACATAVQSDCATCLAGGICEPIWTGVRGMDSCTMLQAQAGPSYALVCVNLAVSLADVGACLSRTASTCAFDATAIADPARLRANLVFVDDPGCQAALDACLVEAYGASASDDGCGCDCGGCDCGGCTNDSEPQCSANDSANQSCGGDNCNGGNCNSSGGGGSCTVAGTPARRPLGGGALGMIVVMLPVPAALLARRRRRAIVVEPT